MLGLTSYDLNAIMALKDLKKLEVLELCDTVFKTKIEKSKNKPPLEGEEQPEEEINIGDQFLEFLGNFPNLHTLNLSETNIPKSLLLKILDKFPNLKMVGYFMEKYSTIEKELSEMGKLNQVFLNSSQDFVKCICEDYPKFMIYDDFNGGLFVSNTNILSILSVCEMKLRRVKDKEQKKIFQLFIQLFDQFSYMSINSYLVNALILTVISNNFEKDINLKFVRNIIKLIMNVKYDIDNLRYLAARLIGNDRIYSRLISMMLFITSYLCPAMKENNIPIAIISNYNLFDRVFSILQTLDSDSNILIYGFTAIQNLSFHEYGTVDMKKMLKCTEMIIKTIQKRKNDPLFVQIGISALTNLSVDKEAMKKIYEILTPEVCDDLAEFLENQRNNHALMLRLVGLIWNYTEKDSVRKILFEKFSKILSQIFFETKDFTTKYFVAMGFANFCLEEEVFKSNQNFLEAPLKEMSRYEPQKMCNGGWASYGPLFDLFKGESEVLRKFASWIVFNEVCNEKETQRILLEIIEENFDFISSVKISTRKKCYEIWMKNDICKMIIEKNDDLKKDYEVCKDYVEL